MSTRNSTSVEHLLAEIQTHLGSIPPFFEPLKSLPPLLESFWHHTQNVYMNNPLPLLFKEKLFLYLSYSCRIAYDLRYHCVKLHSLGLTGQEISTLMQTPLPTEQEMEQSLTLLQTESRILETWPEPDTRLGKALFSCAIWLFHKPLPAHPCHHELQRLLEAHYAYLIAFLSYIRSCHHWVNAYPNLSYEADEAVQQQFTQLVQEEPMLKDLLHDYTTMAKQERPKVQAQQPETHQHEHALHEQTGVKAHELVQQVLNQRMSEFFGIVSHDFKTPLTSIKGNIQYLVRRLRKEANVEQITVAEHKRIIEEIALVLTRAEYETNRLTRIVNGLIEAANIQTQKIEMHSEHHNLATLLNEVVMQQRHMMPKRTIRLESRIDEVPVLIDAKRIAQVITNYLSNALKYSDAEQTVLVSLEVEEQTVRISVHDKGPGISSDEQEHIWERFYRAQGTPVRSGSGIGLGLGLYICRAIIEQHGGQAGVQSTPGQGATFWFTLPLAQPTNTASQAELRPR